MNKMKTKTWVILFGMLMLASMGKLAYDFLFQKTGTIAYIYQDGTCIKTIDLSTVTQSEIFVVADATGSNTITIEPGRICVSEADCPDQICVKSGWLNSAAPIVCLPHKLVISLEAEEQDELDAVVK